MKKKYPLEILRQLNHFKNNLPEESKFVKPTKGYIRYEDIDPDSDFYFQINSYAQNNQGLYYSVSCKPISGNNLGANDANLNFSDLEKKIKEWSNIIKQFNEIPFFDDDPITTNYTKEFFDEYKLIDDDADSQPFDLKRQILIDKYLDSSIKFLEKYEKNTEGADLSEPKKQAENLKRNLTGLSKNEVIKGLSKFWAMCRKKGLPILEQVFFELAKEVVQELGKKMIGM